MYKLLWYVSTISTSIKSCIFCNFLNNDQGHSFQDIWDSFDGFFTSNLVFETTTLANLRIDWKVTPEAHVFKADLPGLKKEEVKVEVGEGRILQISGERSKEQHEKNDKWYRIERSGGKFLRRFQLPDNASIGQIKASMASMENGVLTVTIPIEEEKKRDVKAIKIFG
ncbi:18.1 kDa class I heat shock protein-like [Fagus crenata]